MNLSKLAEKLVDVCSGQNLDYDPRVLPIKLTADCYILYATVMDDECKKQGNCKVKQFYALTGGNSIQIKESVNGKLEHLQKYDVVLMFENTSEQSIIEQSKELPTDVHIIKYFDDDNQPKIDAVRSYKMTDIFDAYYDYGIKNISSIVSGFGNIKPKLYNPESSKDKK